MVTRGTSQAAAEHVISKEKRQLLVTVRNEATEVQSPVP